MVETSTDVADSTARVQWMWNANADSPVVEWKPYSDVETMIIEEAFQAGREHAVLDNYIIDFQRTIQILNSDCNEQRLVQRMVCNRDDIPVREERFTFTPICLKQPFGGLYGWISPFIIAATKYLNITRKQLPSKDKSVVPMIVEKAAAGIIEEGKKVGKQYEAEKVATISLQKKEAGMREVWKCCAYLYTLESFLYKRINETMRLIGDEEYEEEWRKRAETLGPFCLLLWDNPVTNKTIARGTTLYRGANLSDQLISTFIEDCAKKEKSMHSFQSFTSCSRNRAKADPFGNVLFIMKMKHAFTVDLKPYSQYADEEEELVSPGVCFTVDRVGFDTYKEKYVIHLTLAQQYRRKLILTCVLNKVFLKKCL